MNAKLVLIEGISGSGKSTTAKLISSRLIERGVSNHYYLEASKDNPIKPLWPSSPTFREDLIAQWMNLTESMKNLDSVVILECAYWQWPISYMVGYNDSHEDIINISTILNSIIEPLSPKLIYFSHSDVERQIEWIFNLRGEAWANYFLERDMQWPYHKSRGHQDRRGQVKFFKECQSYYDELFNLIKFEKAKFPDPHHDWDVTYSNIINFVCEK